MRLTSVYYLFYIYNKQKKSAVVERKTITNSSSVSFSWSCFLVFVFLNSSIPSHVTKIDIFLTQRSFSTLFYFTFTVYKAVWICSYVIILTPQVFIYYKIKHEFFISIFYIMYEYIIIYYCLTKSNFIVSEMLTSRYPNPHCFNLYLNLLPTLLKYSYQIKSHRLLCLYCKFCS